MTMNELRRMALCMLADYDARTPARLFSCPQELTIQQARASRPIESLRWLTVRLPEFGLHLSSGQVIPTGSPPQLFPVNPGTHVVVKTESVRKSHAEFIS
jgi:2-keto-4-pentenoate hydratase